MAIAVINKASNIGYSSYGGEPNAVRDYSEPLLGQQGTTSYRRKDTLGS